MVVTAMKSEVGDEILTLFIAILMFHSIPKFPIFQQYFQAYPYIVFGIAVILLIYRKKILGVLKR